MPDQMASPMADQIPGQLPGKARGRVLGQAGEEVPMATLAILGGSFNPPHIGHFRIACEVLEQLGPESILFIPCACPVHKPAESLLPFALRLGLLRAMVENEGRFAVSAMEGERAGASYTIDTLRALGREYPQKRLLFIMGAEDVPALPTWGQWEEILRLADIVALPRTPGWTADRFAMVLQELHAVMQGPKLPAVAGQDTPGGGLAYSLNGQRLVHFLWQPVLEISSTLVRERWLDGQNLRYLVPEPVLAQMRDNGALIRECWDVAVAK